jgi:beta-galactosidase
VALITARVVDKAGVVCPDFNEALRFSVSGPGDYRGSYNFYVDPSKPASYHSPGDAELQAEGGLMRVAVRSTFTAGRVTVQASSGALHPGKALFSTKRPR